MTVDSTTYYDSSLTKEAVEKTLIITCDSGDTTDVDNSYGGTVRIVNAFDNDTGDSVSCTVSSNTLTIDNGGGDTDHTYVIKYMIV